MTAAPPFRAPPRRTAYTGARLVDPASGLDAPGGLLTDGKRIIDVGPGLFADGPPEDAVHIDCAGRVLAPGLIDTRAHLREPGAEHQETLFTASRSAAAGGITSILCTPDTDPIIDGVAEVEFISRRARETSLVKVYASAAITVGCRGGQLTEMGLLAENGVLAFTDTHRAVADAGLMFRALKYARSLNLLLVQHPEHPALAGNGTMNAGPLATQLGLPGRPALAETILIERDLRLTEAAGSRIHFPCLSTLGAVEAVAAAKARGVAVTAGTAPQYLALTEQEVSGWRTFAKVSPPLRSETDRAAVAEAVVSGVIDVIASDHAPHHEDNKRQPFEQAAFGMAGLEAVLPLALDFVHSGRMSLLDLLRRVTSGPAAVFRMPGGCLAPGAAADLVMIDLDHAWTLDARKFRSKSKNAPYTAHPVRGRAVRTVVDGRPVFDIDP